MKLSAYPIHVRKKIALSITGGIGFVLLVVMIFVYTADPKGERNPDGSMTRLGSFYATVLESAQSYFGGNRDTISK